jgi:ubiquinone/menaquinone biosynthesis C-methylase UbiE
MRKLNLGSGENVREGYDNLDIIKGYGANIIWDCNKYPYPIKDNTYDYILASHVFEHLNEPERAFNELCRIAKPNAIIDIYVPHFNCEGAFSEPTHIRFFTEKTFQLLCKPDNWKKENKQIAKIIYIHSLPSSLGRWIYPLWFRKKLSLLVRGIYYEIRFRGKVIK